MANWERKFFTEEEKRMLKEGNYLAVAAYEDRVMKEAKADFLSFFRGITAPYVKQGYDFSEEEMRLTHPDWHEGVYVSFSFDYNTGRYGTNVSYDLERKIYGLPENKKISCPPFPKHATRVRMANAFSAIVNSAIDLNLFVLGKLEEEEKAKQRLQQTMAQLLLAMPDSKVWGEDEISTPKVGSLRVRPESVSFEFSLPKEQAEKLLIWAQANL